TTLIIIFFFFFSSRRRHTRFSRDWSSDVCSSDLDKTPYEYYNQELDTVNFSKETWLLIEDENTDPESFQKIRNAVEQGHDVFLFTEESLSYSYYIVDSLGLSMDYERINTVKLVNPHLKIG